MSARGLLGWSLVAFVVAVASCDEDVRTTIYWEDFETVCDGTPCGWERINGDPDQAIWIETIHPGEHGLELTGDVAVRGPGSEPGDPVAASLLTLSVMGTCDAGTTLSIDLALADTFGTTYIATASPFVSSEWQPAIPTTLTFADREPIGVVQVSQIGIRKTGRGSCEITDIVLDRDVIEPGC